MQHCAACGTEYSDQLAACPRCAGPDAERHAERDAERDADEGDADEGDGEEVHRCGRCGNDFQGDACPACGALHGTLACEAHAERPAVGRCVVCGRAVCAACSRGEGRAYRCAEHRDVTTIEGWAQVYTTTTEFEAQLVRENLRAEGVDAQIFSQRDNMLSVDLGELSIVRLLVPVWEYTRARDLIRDHTDTGGEVAFACPACGEAYETGARECVSCGGSLA